MSDAVYLLYTDGASRGNPGHSGAGVVLLAENGDILLTRGEYLGLCTNNVAEYRAMILGLEEAMKVGCRRLRIFLDSELLVKQVNNTYRVKNGQLRVLMEDIKRLLSSLDGYKVSHIVRSQNKIADKLANEAIDKAMQD